MFFPFAADIQDKKIVIIGGGRVAFRKCELFYDFGARITVVAPKLCEAFDEILGDIKYICDTYRVEYIRDAFAVIAASDDAAVNKSVSDWCMARRVPVNVVDEPAGCSFIVPAVLRRGDLTISVSTGGKSPALAGRIKAQLAELYGDEYAERLRYLGELKEMLRRVEPEQEVRRQLLITASGLESSELRVFIEKTEENYKSSVCNGVI